MSNIWLLILSIYCIIGLIGYFKCVYVEEPYIKVKHLLLAFIMWIPIFFQLYLIFDIVEWVIIHGGKFLNIKLFKGK